MFIELSLQVGALLLELAFQIVELLGRFFFANYALAGRCLDAAQHTFVIFLFILSLTTFLVKLHLKELHFLLRDGLVLFKFLLQNFVLFLHFFTDGFKFGNPLSLFNHVSVSFLRHRVDLLLELGLQLVV